MGPEIHMTPEGLENGAAIAAEVGKSSVRQGWAGFSQRVQGLGDTRLPLSKDNDAVVVNTGKSPRLAANLFPPLRIDPAMDLIVAVGAGLVIFRALRERQQAF